MRNSRVFLSYADADYLNAADPLVDELQSHGIEAYSFRNRSSASRDFNFEIQSEIQRADVVVVLWSEHAKKSGYVTQELAFARSQDKEFVLVLLEDIRRPPPLIAREDGIRAFDEHRIGWRAKVAEQVEVYRRYRRPQLDGYQPKYSPPWLKLAKAAIGLGVLAIVGADAFKDLGFKVERHDEDAL
jgi:hypothetical protein